MRNLPLVLLIPVIGACANQDRTTIDFSSSFSQAVPVCEVLSHPRKYLGSEVIVGGLYGNDPHKRILYDPSCSGSLAVQIIGDDENRRNDDKMEKLLKTRKLKGIKSIYRGKIESEPIISECDEDYCFRYKITQARLLVWAP